jgi:hypothetical protein
LGLLCTIDNAAGPIFASCLNDVSKTFPTLALAQKLWNKGDEINDTVNPNNPLISYGILQFVGLNQSNFHIDWNSPIIVPTIIANQLLYSNKQLIYGLSPILPIPKEGPAKICNLPIFISQFSSREKVSLMLVPILIPLGGSHVKTISTIVDQTSRKIVEYSGDPIALFDSHYFKSLIAYCWLKGLDLVLNLQTTFIMTKNKEKFINSLLSMEKIPVTIFISISDRSQLDEIPKDFLYPIIEIEKLDYKDRVKLWKKNLRKGVSVSKEVIYECSRRFRLEEPQIKVISNDLNNFTDSLSSKLIFDACRAELKLEEIEFAQKVNPRFENEKLILPFKQQKQFSELCIAMKSLTKVYYDWGLAKVWNESGILALFTGLSGTGKTMAAEILAGELNIPMYRIDLSQVINKYIGETEKNLKKLFDIAEISDCLLFFDEADALFGKRTDIKDAHDRYANITVNYLLERMERFKGLAILATNKMKNIDEAFQRRIHFIINFPKPDFEQRYEMWNQMIPNTVRTENVDIKFLARNFPLVGGNIRSIVFKACLESAYLVKNENKNILTIDSILRAIKREYDKLNRSVSLDQFGPYQNLIQELEGQK